MQYLQGHILSLLGRVSALGVASIAFYRAFFIYEDEDGIWQNRLDGIWVSIHDRSKTTDHFATALINKIGQLMTRTFDVMFGNKSFSLQMFVVSLNASLGGGILSYLLWLLCIRPKPAWSHHPIGIFAPIILSGLFCLALASLCIRYPKTLVFLVATLPLDIMILYFAFFVIEAVRIHQPGSMLLEPGVQYGLFTLLVLLAVASDFVALIFLRRLLVSVQYAVRLREIVKRLMKSIAALIGALALPLMLVELVEIVLRMMSLNQGVLALPFRPLAIMLIFMDVITVAYCLLPIFTLIFVLLNRLLLPILSRMIYPLSRFQVLRNRAALISFGSLALLIGLGLEQFGIKAILTLLK